MLFRAIFYAQNPAVINTDVGIFAPSGNNRMVEVLIFLMMFEVFKVLASAWWFANLYTHIRWCHVIAFSLEY